MPPLHVVRAPQSNTEHACFPRTNCYNERRNQAINQALAQKSAKGVSVFICVCVCVCGMHGADKCARSQNQGYLEPDIRVLDIPAQNFILTVSVRRAKSFLICAKATDIAG